eukprot:6577449-Prymnesium_polylepis.2
MITSARDAARLTRVRCAHRHASRTWSCSSTRCGGATPKPRTTRVWRRARTTGRADSEGRGRPPRIAIDLASWPRARDI